MILTFGLLSPDKGIEHVIDALPAILARHPDTVYIVLGATHPHVKEQHGETYRLMLESRARAARRRRQHDLPQSLREPGRARRVPRRRRHLRHAVSQAGADHVGHAGLRGRVPARRSSRRRTATRASCSPTGAASSCRGGTPAAIAREVIGLLGDDARSASRSSSAPPRYGREHGAGRASRAATSRASSGRAPSTPSAARTAFQAQTLAEAPGRAARDQPRAPPPHDRRHRHAPARDVQRAALRRRLLPRRQRARAAADDARRGGRHRGRRRSCARSRRATSPS